MVLDVVEEALHRPLSIQSDWARTHAQGVAAAACMGLITTANGGAYGRSWRPTVAGLGLVEEAT